MGITVYGMERLFAASMLGSFRLLFRVCIEIGLGGLVYFAACYILKTDEVMKVYNTGMSYINKTH